MNKKKVLLARPSFFIVNEMKAFINICNYDPVPLKNMDIIKTIPENALAGAVISMAINSDVKESLIEVAIILRNQYPNMPIMLATLVDFDMIKKSLGLKFADFPDKINFLDMTAASNKLILNTKNDILIINRSDIDTDQKRMTASRVVSKFFN